MRKLFSFLTIFSLIFSISLFSENAEARKFGGSKSFGRSYKTAPAQPTQTTNTANPSVNKQTQPNKSGLMGGLLGGLLAGGLFAWLMGSGAFDGLQIFDMKPNGYSFTYAKELLGNLGKGGRNFYLFRQLPLDFVYPLLFMMSNILILSFFLKKIGKLESWFLLVLFPVIAGIFDYLENLGLIYLLTSYPRISEIGVRIISTFTVIKSLFTSLYFVILLFVLAILIFKKKK